MTQHASANSLCTPWSPAQSYEPRYYYMEIIMLVFKLIMSTVVVIFLPETVAQVRWVSGSHRTMWLCRGRTEPLVGGYWSSQHLLSS